MGKGRVLGDVFDGHDVKKGPEPPPKHIHIRG